MKSTCYLVAAWLVGHRLLFAREAGCSITSRRARGELGHTAVGRAHLREQRRIDRQFTCSSRIKKCILLFSLPLLQLAVLGHLRHLPRHHPLLRIRPRATTPRPAPGASQRPLSASMSPTSSVPGMRVQCE